MSWQILFSPPAYAAAFEVFLLGAWMSGAVLSARWSGLGERWKPWVNVLSLVAGPVGWAVHGLAHFGGAQARGAAGAEGASGQAGLAYTILAAALAEGASDIHIEAQEGGYAVRFRRLGLLREHQRVERKKGENLVTVFKVLAELNTAEKTHMQDGRFQWAEPKSGHVLDVRISASPSLSGETVTLRLLNRPASLLQLDRIGLDAAGCEAIRRHLRRPEGLVLVAGPTGSGKTTTSYALLQEVSGPAVNIVTIEDPVEYALPHATQIGINTKMGVTFASGLRTVLRQDPNVIFMGEMRDQESFAIGVRAALSGHLVVSTLHARDTVSALTALRNRDLDRQVLADALRLLISQRLVRELCPGCRVWSAPGDDMKEFFLLAAPPRALPERAGMPSPKGCPQCQQGFIGRTGMFEILRVDAKIRAWMVDGESERELRELLVERGVASLREDACDKLAAGTIWIDDAVRALGM